MRMTREFYLPKEHDEKLEIESGSGIVYLYHYGEVLYSIGFGGKRSKPDFHHRWNADDRRREHAETYLGNIAANEETRRKERAERNAYEHTLKEGDILYSSWGYDQTNIDYYQVTKVVGKKSVKIRRINSMRLEDEDGHFTQDKVVPAKGSWSEHYPEEMLKRVGQGNAVSIASYASAYPWDGTPKYETAFGYGH